MTTRLKNIVNINNNSQIFRSWKFSELDGVHNLPTILLYFIETKERFDETINQMIRNCEV